MPIMDGYESIREIRKFENESKLEKKSFITIVSGNFSKSSDFQVEGMDGWISKPYSLGDIQQNFHKFIKQFKDQQQITSSSQNQQQQNLKVESRQRNHGFWSILIFGIIIMFSFVLMKFLASSKDL